MNKNMFIFLSALFYFNNKSKMFSEIFFSFEDECSVEDILLRGDYVFAKGPTKYKYIFTRVTTNSLIYCQQNTYYYTFKDFIRTFKIHFEDIV